MFDVLWLYDGMDGEMAYSYTFDGWMNGWVYGVIMDRQTDVSIYTLTRVAMVDYSEGAGRHGIGTGHCGPTLGRG